MRATPTACCCRVLELTSPVYDAAAGTMSYVVTVLEGFAQLETTGAGFTEEPLPAASIPAAFGPSSLFIDSLLGVARGIRAAKPI